MKTANLMLHCGADAKTRGDLEIVMTPDATDTWCPIPHHQLVDRVEQTLTRTGYKIINEAHGLTRDGARYFGLMQVGLAGEYHEDYSIVMGIRNSHDKTFPAGLCLGSQVFVCDNLSFYGEVKLSRKHTAYINRDLPGLVNKAVAKLTEHRGQQNRRIETYKQVQLDDKTAHNLLINALDAKVIGPCQLPHVLEQWRKPAHEEFAPRTGWSFFNSFTEVIKGNVQMSLDRTTKLYGLMDSFVSTSA